MNKVLVAVGSDERVDEPRGTPRVVEGDSTEGESGSALSTVGSLQLQDRELRRHIRKDRAPPENKDEPRNPIRKGKP